MRRRLDDIFLWICPSSSCGLYFHQRGHPGCFILLFLVTFSQLLFLCLPVVEEKQNSIWGLGASFIVPSGEVNLCSSGVLSAYSLYPKSTFFFCLVLLSLFYCRRQLDLGSSDPFVFFVLVSLSWGMPKESTSIFSCPLEVLQWQAQGWENFYNLLQLLTVPALGLLLIILRFVDSFSLLSTNSAKLHQNLLPYSPGSAAIFISLYPNVGCGGSFHLLNNVLLLLLLLLCTAGREILWLAVFTCQSTFLILNF